MTVNAIRAHERSVPTATSNGGQSPRPDVRSLIVRLRRVVRTAPYESWEIEEQLEASPDPNFTSRQNLAAMRRLLTAEIDAACTDLADTHKER